MLYQPILPINLDPRNEIQLAAYSKRRMLMASRGRLSDISPGSVPAILAEGTAYAGAQLLNELNRAPEAWTADWLRTLGFLQIASAPSVVGLKFTRTNNTDRDLILDRGMRVSTANGVVFRTSEVVDFLPGETIRSVVALCESEGTVGNVPAGSVTRLLRSIPNLNVTNPVAAYGGRNGESWAQTKGRAFSSLRRRNPVSVPDWEDWFRQLLGANTQVIVIPRQATPTRVFRSGMRQITDEKYSPTEVNLPYDGTVEGLLTKLLDYQKKAGLLDESGDLFNNVLSRAEEISRYNEETSTHMFVFLRSELNTAFEEGILARTREAVTAATWINSHIHVENARAELVSLRVFTESGSNNLSGLETTLFRAVNNYIFRLPINSEIIYNDLLTYLREFAPIRGFSLSSGLLAYNDGLPTELRKSLPLRVLNGRGLIVQESLQSLGEPGSLVRFLPDGGITPAYPYSAWKLDSLTVATSSSSDTIKAGDLLACRGSTALRANFDGTTTTYPNDPICSEGGGTGVAN